MYPLSCFRMRDNNSMSNVNDGTYLVQVSSAMHETVSLLFVDSL
ncbi:hypothetical protein VP150E351_P0146 [Vibrio phage 150E35-1]|nr:hypothetical protein VP150E351_P0146 [Vibrio phage 150E35-1]